MGETHVNEEKSLTELLEETPKADHAQTQERLNGMRKKTDLSDIILEKENSTAARNKKIILGAASLVLIFLIFLIISKLINSDTFKDTQNEINNTEVATVNEEKKVIEDKVKDKQDESISDTDIKFEEMVKRLRAEEAKNDTQIVKVDTPKQENSNQAQTTKVVDNIQIKDETQNETKEKSISTTVTKKTKQEPKIIITDAKKAEPKPKPVTKAKTIKRPNPNLIFGQNSGYYIQVGATTNPTPNRSLINKLRANSYSFITHPVIIKGRKFYKVLIGPFPTKDAAKAKLPRVKATINPQAFLYHIR